MGFAGKPSKAQVFDNACQKTVSFTIAKEAIFHF